jgi:hypothetical protein
LPPNAAHELRRTDDRARDAQFLRCSASGFGGRATHTCLEHSTGNSALGGGAPPPDHPLATVGFLSGGEPDGVEEHDAEAGLDDIVGVLLLGEPLGREGLDILGLLEQLVPGLGELGEAARAELDQQRRAGRPGGRSRWRPPR